MSANTPQIEELNSKNLLLSGAEVIVKCLEKEGVDVVFAYPGGASMPIHQALSKSKQIRTLLPRHEQGGGFAAEGYARACGKVGVCISTSGPGATNLVTSIADAFLDSTPLVAITGQVPRAMIGRGAFQETDIFGVTAPVVKHSYLVTDPNDIPRIIKEAFYIASSGRPGPVVIDVPKDCQELHITPQYPDSIDLPGYNPQRSLDEQALSDALDLLMTAKRPMIYAGGGIISSPGASEALLEFVERTHIPVATTLMGIGAFPESHELSLRWLGMHGTIYANNAVNESDLLFALGVRFDDRVTGKVEKFVEHGKIVHIDIDNSEINKNKQVCLPVIADVGEALRAMNSMLEANGFERSKGSYDRYADWFGIINRWRRDFPFRYNDTPDLIQPQFAIELLYEMSKDRDTIITTGVGQHQMFAAQFYKFNKPRRFITSAGLGSMGYGYPAAIGAKMACPECEVIDIDGDGSFIMNVQELALAKVENINVKCMILNNQHLGMVVQWEDLKYDSNRAQTFLADPADEYDPTHRTEDVIYPNYPMMCASFGIKCERVIHKHDLPSAIKRMLESKEPYVLDVMVPYEVHVLPMIPGGMGYKDVIIERISGDGKGKTAAEAGVVIPSAL